MKLRSWTMDHTRGVLLGMLSPLIFVPLVLLVIMWMQDYYFEQLWDRFTLNTNYRIRIITLSIISNLIWFYLFLNRERYNIAMGVILGSIAYAPYIVYIKFF